MPGGIYPPPSVVESWPKPNYVDPETQGSALNYVCIIFSSLSLAVVTARTYSRIFMTKAPGADDLLVVISAALGIALSVMIMLQQKVWMTGHHIWDIPIDKLAGQRKNIYICEWFYVAASSSVKISILLFYRRLSVTFSKTFLIATYVGIAYNVAYFVSWAVVLLCIFRPIQAYWLSFDPIWAATHHYTHGNESWSLPASAGLSVIGDFYSTLLPLLLIRFLDLPQRQKAALYSLFGLGFLVVAAGIVRTVLLDRVLSKTYDESWVLWEDWIWTVIELNVAIWAASAPALKPFFRRFLIDPIIKSSRGAAYAYDSRRRSSAGKLGGSHRFGRSNTTTTARDSNPPMDMEKIGIALAEPRSKAEIIEDEIDDGVSMRRYQLRTSRDGRLVPVQMHEQGNFDAHSLHTADSSDYILSPDKSGDFDASTDLRQYRAQIEGLPPIPNQQEYQLNDLSVSQTRPHIPSDGMRGIPGPLNRNPNQSSARSKPGSVKAARIRLQQLRELEPQNQAHARSVSYGSDRNFSRPSTIAAGSSPYQHFTRDEDDTCLDERTSSRDTLGLSRQGSRDGVRPLSVGYAV